MSPNDPAPPRGGERDAREREVDELRAWCQRMRKFSEHEQYAAHGLVAHSYALTAARYRRLLSVLEEHEKMRAALKHIADASDCLDDSPDAIALHVIGCMGALGLFQAGVAERHEVTPAMVEAAAQVLWGIGADPWRERFAAWQHPSLIAITHAALQSAARAGGEV